MNKVIESLSEEKLKRLTLNLDGAEPDGTDSFEDLDTANAIWEAHDDPC